METPTAAGRARDDDGGRACNELAVLVLQVIANWGLPDQIFAESFSSLHCAAGEGLISMGCFAIVTLPCVSVICILYAERTTASTAYTLLQLNAGVLDAPSVVALSLPMESTGQ